MIEYKQCVQIRWSDLDPNFHLRHSVYYDWGAYCRVAFLNEFGLTTQVMQELKIGPILFREEAVFRKEVLSGDMIEISLMLTKAKRDFSRWSIQHFVIKNKEMLCAVLTVDGAWLNVVARKLAVPPKEAFEVFSTMPKSETFAWIDKN